MEEPSSRWRSILLNGLLSLAGVVGVVMIAEGVMGLLWEAPWYERLLAEQETGQQQPYRRNSLGMRGPEIEPKPPGVRRLLVIGDSFTFGLGVRDDRAPFPAILDASLPTVEVVNGGIPGSLTGDWLALWNQGGALVDPDVVLVVFFLRDGTTLGTIPHFFKKIREEVAKRNEADWLYRTSNLYRRVRDFMDRSWVADTYTRDLTNAYLGPFEKTGEWRRAQRHLLELRDVVTARGAVFGFAVFPVLVELDEAYPFRPVTDLLMRFADVNDIPAHDLLPAFMGRNAADLWVSGYDQHPNAHGHQLAGESLLPFVQGLLDDREAGLSASRR